MNRFNATCLTLIMSAVALCWAPRGAVANASVMVQQLTLKDHVFTPKVITIPANQKIKIVIKNENGQVAEFKSFALNRDITIPDEQEVPLFVGPLKPGTYSFFDSLDVNKATGKIIVN